MRLAACLFLLVSTLQLSASDSAAVGFSLTLERTGCEAICPWYSVTILGDGSVHYEGTYDVHAKGTRKRIIPVSDVNKLIKKLQDQEFFHWKVKTDFCVDYPRVIITASLNGQHNQVEEACRQPGKVLALAEEVDTIADTKNWVGNVLEELIQEEARSRVSDTLIGKHIAIRGKFSLRGVIAPYVLLDNQQVVYLVPSGSFKGGKPYSEMEDKLVVATGVLKCFHSPHSKLAGAAVARVPDYYYFEADTAQLRLIVP